MNMKRLIQLLAAGWMLWQGTAMAASAHPPVPTTLAGVEVADSARVKGIMEAGGAILDARKAEDFKGGTIPGAFNCQVSSGDPDLGDAQVDGTVKDLEKCEGLKKADKAKEIVTFCNGETCWRSPKASLALKKMGFAKVLWYRLGGNDWKAQGLPME